MKTLTLRQEETVTTFVTDGIDLAAMDANMMADQLKEIKSILQGKNDYLVKFNSDYSEAWSQEFDKMIQVMESIENRLRKFRNSVEKPENIEYVYEGL